MEQSQSPVSSDPGLETQVQDLILEALNYDDRGMRLVIYCMDYMPRLTLYCRRHTKSIARV